MKMLVCFRGFSLLGLVSLGYGLICTLKYRHRRRTELERAEAVFVGYVKKKHSTSRYSWKYGYHPVLEFTDHDRKYQVQARIFHDEEKLKKGDRVILFYDGNNPAHFHLEEEDNGLGSGMIRLSWFIFAFAGVVSLLVQIFVFRNA